MGAKRKLGLAGASLLGAATMVGIASPPASADIVIICPCEENPGPGADPFLKLEAAFQKVMVKIIEVKGTDSPVTQRLDDTFHKILLK